MGMIAACVIEFTKSGMTKRVSKPVLSREVTETVMPTVSKKSMVVAEYSVHRQSVERLRGRGWHRGQVVRYKQKLII